MHTFTVSSGSGVTISTCTNITSYQVCTPWVRVTLMLIRWTLINIYCKIRNHNIAVLTPANVSIGSYLSMIYHHQNIQCYMNKYNFHEYFCNLRENCNRVSFLRIRRNLINCKVFYYFSKKLLLQCINLFYLYCIQ